MKLRVGLFVLRAQIPQSLPQCPTEQKGEWSQSSVLPVLRRKMMDSRCVAVAPRGGKWHEQRF